MEQCASYIHLTKANVTTWWTKVRKGATPPTDEQKRFLEQVIARCQTEGCELQKWHAPKGTPRSKKLSEPSRTARLGIPGAGKSLCLTLMRDFFENVMGWRHGVQFQFLASQNSIMMQGQHYSKMEKLLVKVTIKNLVNLTLKLQHLKIA